MIRRAVSPVVSGYGHLGALATHGFATTSILNVDDYPPGLYARTKILSQAGFEVMEATTGSQTLKLVSEHKPAVVLLDVNLPDMHGFEVCRRMRTNPALAATTILHISASSIQNNSRFMA